MKQVDQTITFTLDHTTPQNLTTAIQDHQLLKRATIFMEALHPLINHQEIMVTLEPGAVQGLRETHHLQVAQAEEAAALPEVKRVHHLNQEEEDNYIKT